MGLETDRAARDSLTASARPLIPPGVSLPRDPVLLADATDANDLLGVGEAVRPLAELCLAPEAQTPFLVGIVGGSGAGKSFALKRLVGAVEALAAAAAKTATSPFLSKVVIAPLDAAGFSGDPASALASAAFVALERERGGVNYFALADEAAHATADPRRAAVAAAERHDEISRRLEAERIARDEVDAKRARLTEALLYETPGSRVDSFIRTSRPLIDARLRRFGLADGDSAANYRDLVRDLATLGAGSRYGLALRGLWAYRGQPRLLILALLAFALAFGIDRLRAPSADAAIRRLGDWVGPAADWVSAHGEGLERAVEALIVLGLLAIFVNVWRAVGFSTLLFRGLRLLAIDMRERRRELDASAARLERRVVALGAEADAASKRSDMLARRAGAGTGASHFARGPGPAFLQALETPAKTSREFFAELGRLMAAPASPGLSVPQRLILVIDNLGALAPTDATRLIEAVSALLGPGCAALIACDPSAVAPAPGPWARGVFQIMFDAGALHRGDGRRLAARLLTSGAPSPAFAEADASQSTVAEPLAPAETALLTALAPLIEPTPRGVKRFHNAYRLARTAKAPRPVVALALAALQSPDADVAPRLREAILAEGERFEDPAGPAKLIAAIQAARATQGGPIPSADALAAWDAARRYAPEF